jgi:sulfoxide reductase heme-binding subunit YedZ
MTRRTRDRIVYAVVWLACLSPLLCLVWWGLDDQLGANPINTGLRFLGLWGLRFLVAGLAITPLRGWFGWHRLQRYRRTIGLWGFAYIALHLLTYIGVDQFFDWPAIVKDVLKRPYITFGMLGFTLLLPLAITSTNAMVRRLGGRRWRRLHKLAYLIAPLGVLHYDLLVKSDTTWPWFYAGLLTTLLGWRAWQARTRRVATRPVSA